MGNVYTLLCYRSAELSKAFRSRNLCYSKIYVVMLLEYRIAALSKTRARKKICPAPKCCIRACKKLVSYMSGAKKNTKTIVEFRWPKPTCTNRI